MYSKQNMETTTEFKDQKTPIKIFCKTANHVSEVAEISTFKAHLQAVLNIAYAFFADF